MGERQMGSVRWGASDGERRRRAVLFSIVCRSGWERQMRSEMQMGSDERASQWQLGLLQPKNKHECANNFWLLTGTTMELSVLMN